MARQNDITTGITKARLVQIIRAALNQEVRRLLSSDASLLGIVTQQGLDLDAAELNISDLQAGIPFVLNGDGLAYSVDGLTLNVIGSSSIGVDTDLELILDSPSGLQVGPGGLSIEVGSEFFALDAINGLVTPFWDSAYIASTIAALVGPSDRHFLIVSGEFDEANFSKNSRIFFGNTSLGSPTFSLNAGDVASGTAISTSVIGSGNASGIGGGMTFKAGGGSAGNLGGQFNLTGGDGGSGGNVFIAGGNASDANASGGFSFIDGGTPKGTGSSGVTIRARSNTGGGIMLIRADAASGLSRLGFFGSILAKPAAYTITSAPAKSRALNAGSIAGVAAVLRQLIKDLNDYGLLTGTGY